MLAPILSFLGTRWMTIAFALAGLGFLWSNGYYYGHKSKKAEVVELKAELKRIAEEGDKWMDAYRNNLRYEQEAHAKALKEIGTKLKSEQVANDKLRKALKDATTTLVPPAADAKCVVNSGFVSLHNAAATGGAAEVAAAASRPASDVEAPSGVALSAVAEITAENYLLAREWRAQLIAWQDWYTSWQKWYADWAEKQK